MTGQFTAAPNQLRAMASRFAGHAKSVEDEARKFEASSQNNAGADRGGAAQGTPYDTRGQMNQAFRNIVNLLQGVRDDLTRDASNYEQQEHAPRRSCSE